MQWQFIHSWLTSESYWAKDIPFEIVKTAGENAFCIGIFHDGKQVGYARVITDYAVFGYLADVFVVKEHRGNGLSKFLLEKIMKLEWITRLRIFMLSTMDAQELYKLYGFKNPKYPERIMEIKKLNMYTLGQNI